MAAAAMSDRPTVVSHSVITRSEAVRIESRFNWSQFGLQTYEEYLQWVLNADKTQAAFEAAARRRRPRTVWEAKTLSEALEIASENARREKEGTL